MILVKHLIKYLYKEHSYVCILSIISFEIKSPLQRPLWINPDDGWTFARDQNWQPVHNWLKSIMKENSLFSIYPLEFSQNIH